MYISYLPEVGSKIRYSRGILGEGNQRQLCSSKRSQDQALQLYQAGTGMVNPPTVETSREGIK